MSSLPRVPVSQFEVTFDTPSEACKPVCQFNYTGLLGLAGNNPLYIDTKVSCSPVFIFMHGSQFKWQHGQQVL